MIKGGTSVKRTYITLVAPVSVAIFALVAYFLVFHFQNRYWRDVWQQPEKLMEIAGVKQGMVVGEAGAGRGYLTFKLLQRVGDRGHVYANDIDEVALSAIRRRSQKEGIQNVTIVKGTATDPLFPEKDLDLVIMLLVLHHITNKEEWLGNLKSYMGPQTPLVIIERDPQRYWGRDRNHFMRKKEVLETLRRASFELSRLDTSLPRDNVYIFKAKDNYSALTRPETQPEPYAPRNGELSTVRARQHGAVSPLSGTTLPPPGTSLLPPYRLPAPSKGLSARATTESSGG
jgi:ubiquinone/menaquinone biosynthesis C-methylase UbiE